MCSSAAFALGLRLHPNQHEVFHCIPRTQLWSRTTWTYPESRETLLTAKWRTWLQSIVDTSDDLDEEEKLYCVCKQPWEEGQDMVACESCQDWFHPECLNSTMEASCGDSS